MLTGVEKPADSPSVTARRERWVGLVLLACILVVMAWTFAAWRARQPLPPYITQPALFDAFRLEIPGWTSHRTRLPDSPYEANLLVCRLRSEAYPDVLVRLVHGYNMPNCMRLKGCAVEPLPAPGGRAGREVQAWQVVSALGDTNLWLTTVVAATNFAPAAIDIRDMPFPGTDFTFADGWHPTGFSLADLRRPFHSLRRFLTAAWHSSQRDPGVMLKWNAPPRPSDEWLVLIVAAPQGGDPAAQRRDFETLGRHTLQLLAGWAAQTTRPL